MPLIFRRLKERSLMLTIKTDCETNIGQNLVIEDESQSHKVYLPTLD